jgi:hypothetical protein
MIFLIFSSHVGMFKNCLRLGKKRPGIGSLVSEDAEINETGEDRHRGTVMVQMLGISPQWLLNGKPFVEEIHHGNSKLLINIIWI